MKNWRTVIIGVLVILGIVWLVLRGQEDTWILDEQGVWIKHGNPKNKPEKVVQQEELIKKATALYQEAKIKGTDFANGPCLGNINNDWVVDIAHNPRQNIDNLPENQCTAQHFIELDSEGSIIKIR